MSFETAKKAVDYFLSARDIIMKNQLFGILSVENHS